MYAYPSPCKSPESNPFFEFCNLWHNGVPLRPHPEVEQLQCKRLEALQAICLQGAWLGCWTTSRTKKGVFVCWGRDGSDRKRQYDWTLTWTFICIECVNVYNQHHEILLFFWKKKNPSSFAFGNSNKQHRSFRQWVHWARLQARPAEGSSWNMCFYN